MKARFRQVFLAAFLAFGMIAHPAVSQDAPFSPVKLAYGISLEVPSHWTVLSLEDRKNIAAAGQAAADNAGVDGAHGRKESLFAMNASPSPTGAMIRLSVSTPSSYSQSDLGSATRADLDAVGAGAQEAFRRLEGSGGPKVLQVEPVVIEEINGFHALALSYVRASADGSSPWRVTQYKIPVAGRLVELTLSQRLSDEIVWRAVLERVKRSVRF